MPAQTSRSLALSAIAFLALAACGDKGTEKKGEEAGHDHKAPHDGEVLELGKEEGHLEMIHDHVGGNLVVYVYGSSFEKPLSVKMPVVTIMVKGAEVNVPLTAVDAKPDGTAHQWKGGHEGLRVDPWDGRIEVVLSPGKPPLRSPLEGPAHSHK